MIVIDYSKYQRFCLDCQTDITLRHPVAVRCKDCQRKHKIKRDHEATRKHRQEHGYVPKSITPIFETELDPARCWQIPDHWRIRPPDEYRPWAGYYAVRHEPPKEVDEWDLSEVTPKALIGARMR